MNIRDLMVDDLIIATEYVFDENTDEESYIDHYARITDISPNGILDIDGNECNFSIEWVDNCDAEHIENELKPIPLTEEMLLANGIEKLSGYDSIFALPDRSILVEINDSGWGLLGFVDHNDNAYPLISVWYVHELQHALRLCGEKMLVNNFKLD